MTMPDDDQSAIPAMLARKLFADWADAPAIVLAVSGGPDSVALMWLAARWRRAFRRGPDLLAVTVDHGLRPEATREARDVERLAAALAISHRTMRWTGAKPKTGLPAAARAARYALLSKAAGAIGATHVLTAHTRDDQAETILMRMARGSGLSGLAAMARQTERDGIMVARPFLQLPKARLVATLAKAKIDYVVDPSNFDSRFTRPRLRALMPELAAEGLDSRNLERLCVRLRQADTALDLMADGAERFLARQNQQGLGSGLDARAYAGLPVEIRIRLLRRMIDRVGHEGPAELGKVEHLVAAVDAAMVPSAGSDGKGILLKQTLAGALISLTPERLKIVPAPPRRRRPA